MVLSISSVSLCLSVSHQLSLLCSHPNQLAQGLTLGANPSGKVTSRPGHPIYKTVPYFVHSLGFRPLNHPLQKIVKKYYCVSLSISLCLSLSLSLSFSLSLSLSLSSFLSPLSSLSPSERKRDLSPSRYLPDGHSISSLSLCLSVSHQLSLLLRTRTNLHRA
jgi:hypothetical protein